MVYRGKPSGACSECRRRRNRCDQAIPACGQCVKTKRVCPGYRNAVDLMFFDESSNVAVKARSRNSPPKDAKDSKTPSPPRNDGGWVRAPTYAQPVRFEDMVLYQPLDDLAVNFFMSNYVGTDAAQSQFDYLPEFYLRDGFSHPHVRDSVKAVGLAGYAKAMGQQGVSQAATKSYVSAIREVNVALSKPSSAGRYSTLISVLLLGMFEVQMLPKQQGLENMTKHLNGAISIAGLLIKQQEELTDLGKRLVRTLSQNVIMNCWIQSVPLPPGFIEMRRQMRRDTREVPTPHSIFLDVIADIIAFRTRIEHDDYQHPESTMTEAIVLDHRVEDFQNNMPASGYFEVAYTDDFSDTVFEGYYHIYPRNFTAHLWNNIRMSRIRLHNIILQQCRHILSTSLHPDTATLAAQIESSKAIVRDMAREICAGVPQLAGYLAQIDPAHMDKIRPPGERRAYGPAQSSGTSSISPPVRPASNLLFFPTPFAPSADTTYYHPHPVSKFQNIPKSSESVSGMSSLPAPKPQSQYHILHQLHTLAGIDFLPSPMLKWIRERIVWIEGVLKPENLELLKAMLKKKGVNKQSAYFQKAWT